MFLEESQNKINKINTNIHNNLDINTNNIHILNKSIENINTINNTSISLIRNINLDKKDLFNNIGVLDPDGNENNPLTDEPYKNLYYDPNKELSKTNFTYKSLAKNVV